MLHGTTAHVRATGVCFVLTLAMLSSAQVLVTEQETVGGQNNTFGQAEDLTGIGNFFVISGVVHSGVLNSDDEWFKFNGDSGATVDIDMTILVPISVGVTYQHNIWLFDSSERMIAAWNTSTASPGVASIGIETYTLPATDTYYIYVTEWSVSPSALSPPQPTITFVPLSVRGHAVLGATPDSTRDTAGGLQTTGSTWEITVGLSSGNGGGPTCVFNAPTAPGPVSGLVLLDFDLDDPASEPIDVLIEFSTNGGTSFQNCTAGPASATTNPSMGVATPTPAVTFEWDSKGDGVGLAALVPVDLRISLDNPLSATTGSCQVAGLDVDNRSIPTCVISAPAPPGPVTGVVAVVFDVDDADLDPVSILLEYSTDGGATFAPASLGPASPLAPNPAAGIATPSSGLAFDWDSRTDSVGLAAPVTSQLRLTVDDGLLVGSCSVVGLDVDNTQICGGICGDCDLNGNGPNILDALIAAQIAAGLITLTVEQEACCDVDSSGAVGILDALRIAQEAAGLVVVLTCL